MEVVVGICVLSRHNFDSLLLTQFSATLNYIVTDRPTSVLEHLRTLQRYNFTINLLSISMYWLSISWIHHDTQLKSKLSIVRIRGKCANKLSIHKSKIIWIASTTGYLRFLIGQRFVIPKIGQLEDGRGTVSRTGGGPVNFPFMFWDLVQTLFTY